MEETDKEHHGDGARARQPEPGAETGPGAKDSNSEATHNFDGKILRKIVDAGGKTSGDRMAFSDERVVREVKRWDATAGEDARVPPWVLARHIRPLTGVQIVIYRTFNRPLSKSKYIR